MSEATSPSVRVLYVDDERDVAALVASHLQRGDDDGESRSLTVDTYTDPEAAYEYLRDGGADDVDCVVSDHEMPNMDGLELLEAVRERWPDLPFVLFTGRGSEDVASKAISRGVTEYMQKGTDPEQFEVLANRVRNAVEKREAERQLERAETRYRRLVEQNLTGILIVRAGDGTIAYANPKCAEIFGYDQADLAEKSAHDLVAEEDRAVLEDRIRASVAGDREEVNYTLTGVRASGEHFEFEIHSGVVEHEGEPAILGSLVDVTEQRERERELEEYRELVETVGDPMFVLDRAGRVQKANRAMAEMLGRDRASLVGAHASEFVTAADLETGGDVARAFLADEVDPPRTFEVEFETADGERIPCEVNLSTLTDGDGERRGTVGVIRVIAERKARERELEEYETIVETAPDGVYVIDEDGYFINCNETGAELVGYDRESLRGEHVSTLVEAGVLEEDAVDRYADGVEELLSAGSDRRKAKFEATIRSGDGERTVEVHTALLPRGDADDFRGTVDVVRDITERKAIEEALREERDRQSALFENIPEPAIVYGFEDGRPHVRRVNDAFEATFGFEEEEVAGRPLDEYIVPEGRVDEAIDLNQRVVAGEPLDVEIQRRTADGEIRDFLLRNASIPTDDGIEGYAIYTDITDRKERERRLGALHDATRDLMEATSTDEVAEIGIEAAERVLGLAVAGFYGYDEDDGCLRPVSVTDGAREVFGEVPVFEMGEGIPWQVFESGEPVVTDDVRGREEAFSPDAPVRSEMVLPAGDHGVFVAASREVAAFDEAEQSLAKVLVSNVESALDRARREALLLRRERALLRQNERLEEFAGVVSHDLRSPLTVAKGNVYLLRTSGDEEYLDRIERALDRMEGLIDDLLTLARQGRTVDEPELVDLREAVDEAWSTTDSADATCERALGERRLVEADPGRLRELLENLFRNAVEHGGPGVTVTVGTTADGFYVDDDGGGFDEEVREQLFDPGFTTQDHGTGFGLSIVRQIAEAHGWEVRATDSDEGGARFEFTDVEIVPPAEA